MGKTYDELKNEHLRISRELDLAIRARQKDRAILLFRRLIHMQLEWVGKGNDIFMGSAELDAWVDFVGQRMMDLPIPSAEDAA